VDGQMLSNAQILDCLERGVITLEPFDHRNLRLAHYRLRPSQLWRPSHQLPDGSHQRTFLHDFGDGPYEFRPKEYLVVTPLEHVTIHGNLVGSMLPASTLVDQCFSLTAGKLDPGYGNIGEQKQDFIMGLTNLLDKPNWFHPGQGVANIAFTDFRASKVLPTSWSIDERRIFQDRERRRRAEDDGPFYDEEI